MSNIKARVICFFFINKNKMSSSKDACKRCLSIRELDNIDVLNNLILSHLRCRYFPFVALVFDLNKLKAQCYVRFVSSKF